MYKTNLMPTLQEKYASGAVATFNTALAIPLVNGEFTIQAYQEGSGDPAPDNVRNIIPFNTQKITKTGLNIKPNSGNTGTSEGVSVVYNPVDETYTLNGTFSRDGGNIVLGNYSNLDWKIGERYRLSVHVVSGSFTLGSGTGITYAVGIFNFQGSVYIRGGTTLGASGLETYSANGVAFKSNGNYRLYFQLWRTGTVFNNLKIKVQIEKNVGEATRPYVPYVTPTAYTIQLGETVYGGSYNSATGDKRKTWNKKTVGELSFTAQSGNRFTATISDCVNTPDFTGFLCSTYKPILVNANNNTWLSNRVITIVDNRYTTATEFKEAMGDTQIVYPIAEPIESNIGATEIETYDGSNNIFCDTGDTSLTYKDLDIAKRGNFREVFKLPS